MGEKIMALTKKPVNGMKDILPREMQIRDYVMSLMKETYGRYGFSLVETPCVEHIENLLSKQGGENEKLIFKILKRGEKLKLDEAEKEADLVDMGLRYDLTLPLSRYYANNVNNLVMPFKALQMGAVWRADRPQKGRFRQFVQCDIDILGDATYLAEVELISATTTLLGKLDFKDFKVRINDRRILKAMATFSGFPEDKLDIVFIILDKMDKIGLDGVAKELEESGFEKKSIDIYLGLFEKMVSDREGLCYLKDILKDVLEENVVENLENIMCCVEETKSTTFEIIFDPTLVRGMSYYTGTIFEIEMEELKSSVAGGGRYDEMIGKFTGNPICACGFSIGFERIVTILLDRNFEIPFKNTKKVFLLEKGMIQADIYKVMKMAAEERNEGTQVLVVQMNKNKKFQKDQLTKEGYTEFQEFYKDTFQK